MRLNVTKVLDRVANQLQKSSILDDPIKLIYSVMHSNDCIARALTLRFVCSVFTLVTKSHGRTAEAPVFGT